MPSDRARPAFTLLELLMVVTIIMVLMGLAVGIGVEIREKAKESATSMRMEHILSALANYSTVDGSIAMVLQNNLGLGGAVQFATVHAIDSVTTGAGNQPPGFRYYYKEGPNPFVTWDITSANWQSGPGGTFDIQTFWRSMGDLVFDVMPANPTVVAPTAQWLTWWPTQWTWTDWDQASPGSNPPILRFPWGRPGLRTDGTVCDPEIAAGVPAINPTTITETQTSGGSSYTAPVTYRLANSWATMGAAAAGSAWSWTNNDASQTDYVTITSATRSDGTAVPAASVGSNLPIPFDLGYCSPMQTIILLQAAGVLDSGAAGGAEYRTDRGPSKPWNDAWGNPLVVVYAIYQPERYFRKFDQYDRRDLFLRQAQTAYQFNRAIYFAVGAAGQTLYAGVPTSWGSASDSTQDAATLRQYWLQIRDVCSAASWTEAAWQNPPWNGSKVGKKNGSLSMMTAPIMVK